MASSRPSPLDIHSTGNLPQLVAALPEVLMKQLHIPSAIKGKPSWATPDGAAAFWHGEPFNGGGSWIGRFRVVSQWEIHPDGD